MFLKHAYDGDYACNVAKAPENHAPYRQELPTGNSMLCLNVNVMPGSSKNALCTSLEYMLSRYKAGQHVITLVQENIF